MVDIYVGTENTHYVLHEKLLCAKSKYFANVFYKGVSKNSYQKTFGLPDEDDGPFRLFVGWLYSSSVPIPDEEKDLGDLFDLYLMGERWQIAGLIKDVLDTVRAFYRLTTTYPSLRRVQYLYANTDSDSPMRQLLIGCVARMLALAEATPAHWDKALRKNGELAVDIMGAIQGWRLDGDAVPDPREDVLEKEDEKMRLVEEEERTLQKGIDEQPGGKPEPPRADDEEKKIKQEENDTGLAQIDEVKQEMDTDHTDGEHTLIGASSEE